MKISDVAKSIHKNASEKGWWRYKPESNATDFSNGLIAMKLLLANSELAEAFEELRSGKSPSEIYYSKAKDSELEKPEGFPIEIADCIIRLFDLCVYFNIDIENAIKVKEAFNASRAFRHGNKTA